MSLLSRLFGGGSSTSTPKAAAQPEVYNGYSIYPEPANEGSRWRVGARIEKEIDGEIRTHTLIRADTLEDMNSAVSASLGKARQIIDEQGDGIFR